MTDFNNNFNQHGPAREPRRIAADATNFHELAEELDTSVEQVETWIREADIKPMSDEEHACYHAEHDKPASRPSKGRGLGAYHRVQ